MTPEALSASKVERVANCTASAILPSYPHTGKLAIAGTERHADIEEERTPLPGDLELPGMEHEVAYLIDPRQRTVVRIGAGMPRKYGVGRPWYTVGTTLDIEHVEPERALAVDVKSRKRVTAARRNWQVRLQALALYETYKRPVTSGLLYLDNGEKDFHDFSRFDHAATWTDLDAVIAGIEAAIGKTPKPHIGPWCEYCTAVLVCPAVNQALMGMMEMKLKCDGTDEFEGVPAADVAKLHPTLKAIKAKYERMWQALRFRAKIEDLPLGNGRHLRMVEDKRGVWTLAERKDSGT